MNLDCCSKFTVADSGNFSVFPTIVYLLIAPVHHCSCANYLLPRSNLSILRMSVSFELMLYGNRMDILRSSLANLEDEIFLKGGGVVTPQKFNHGLYIKNFARELIFFPLLDFLLILEPFFSSELWSFPPRGTFQK